MPFCRKYNQTITIPHIACSVCDCVCDYKCEAHERAELLLDRDAFVVEPGTPLPTASPYPCLDLDLSDSSEVNTSKHLSEIKTPEHSSEINTYWTTVGIILGGIGSITILAIVIGIETTIAITVSLAGIGFAITFNDS